MTSFFKTKLGNRMTFNMPCRPKLTHRKMELNLNATNYLQNWRPDYHAINSLWSAASCFVSTLVRSPFALGGSFGWKEKACAIKNHANRRQFAIDCFRRTPTLACRHTNWIIVSSETPEAFSPFYFTNVTSTREIESRSITKSSSFFLNKHFQFSPISYVMEARKSRERNKEAYNDDVNWSRRAHRWKNEESLSGKFADGKSRERGDGAERDR